MKEEIQETALAKLARARKILRGSKLTKSGENQFVHYKYFELSDFLPQVLDALDEVGLTPAPINFTAEIATLTIVDSATREEISITSPMSTADLKGCHPVQNLGAVQTYLRRYLWNAAMELIENDPLDSSKPVDNGTKQEAPLPSRPVKVPPRSPQREEPAGESVIWKGLIDKSTAEPGVSKTSGKPFTRYRITMENGDTASTLKESTFAKVKGWDVLHEAEVEVSYNEKYKNWEWLDIEKVETPELNED